MATPLNTRIYYATEAVGIAPFSGPTDYKAVRGVQSVGLSGRLAIEYIFELGNLPTYDSFEDIPEVEVTIERTLDGYAPAYLSATEGAVTSDIAGRSNKRCHVALSVHRDNQSRASGNQVREVICSGMYASSVGYDFMMQGAFKETLGLVGNNRQWNTGSFVFTGMTAAEGVSTFAPAATEGVNRREHLVMTDCLFPNDLPGISSNLNPEITLDGNVQFACSIESIKVAASFGRTSKKELGRKAVYFRTVDYPVDVTCTFDVAGKNGDEVVMLESQENTTEQPIKLVLEEGLVLDLGTRNRLNSVSHSGANAGSQGDVTLSFSYTNKNDLDVKHPADPTTALRP